MLVIFGPYIILYKFLCGVISIVCIQLVKPPDSTTIYYLNLNLLGFNCVLMREFYFISFGRNSKNIFFILKLQNLSKQNNIVDR